MKSKKERVIRLKKEIAVKDHIIHELVKVVSNHKIKLPENLLRNIIILYKGEDTND